MGESYTGRGQELFSLLREIYHKQDTKYRWGPFLCK
jgi:hypothetical protein